MSSPNPELQAGVRFFCSMVEHHVGADHKGVLKEQGVRHALHAAVDGLLAGLALAQALKAKQRQRLMESARARLQVLHKSCCSFCCPGQPQSLHSKLLATATCVSLRPTACPFLYLSFLFFSLATGSCSEQHLQTH